MASTVMVGIMVRHASATPLAAEALNALAGELSYRCENKCNVGLQCLLGFADIGDELAPPRLLAKYLIGKTIGEGNFAVVKECTEKTRKTKYALKIINKAKCRGREQMIESEVSILRRVKHSNIIQLMEDYNTADEMYLVMELVKVSLGGSNLRL